MVSDDFQRLAWILSVFLCVSGCLFIFIEIFMDFRGFHEISCISGVGGFAAFADVCGRNDAPEETFTRSQLAVVSSIFMDF